LKLGPLPVAPNCAKFTLWTQIAGGPLCQTSFFMKYTLAMSAADSLTLCTTLAASWNTRMAPQTIPAYSLVRTSVNDLGSRTGVETFLVVAHPGTAAAVAVQAATCFVMSAKVALKYRGGHSRVYIPGITTANESDSNTWSPAGQGLIFTAWTGMLSDLTTSPPVGVGGMSEVVVRYQSSNKADFPPNAQPPSFPALLNPPLVLPITSWATNPQFGSQRRRNQQ
jgi:hypothetical protein